MSIRRTNRAPRGAQRRRSAFAATLTAVAIVGVSAACSSVPGKPSSQPYPNVSVDPVLRDSLPADTRADGVLTIVTDPSYPPMEFLESSEAGTSLDPIGADIEIGRAIAAKFGLTPKFEKTAFSNVVPSVAIREFELGISSLWADNPQASMVNMVTYFEAGTQIAIRAASKRPKQTLTSFCGQSVAVEEGAEYIDTLVARSARCIKEGDPPVEIKTANSQQRASKLLEDGAVDAMVGDSPTVQWTISRSNGEIVPLGQPMDIRPYGIAVSPRYPELTRSTAAAVQQLMDSGVYAEILARWNISDGAIAKSEIRFGVKDPVG